MRSNGDTPLTERQLELLGFVASGLTIEQAAEEVCLARQSAYNVLSSARSRAGASTVTYLAVLAIERGWLKKDGEGRYSPAVLV